MAIKKESPGIKQLKDMLAQEVEGLNKNSIEVRDGEPTELMLMIKCQNGHIHTVLPRDERIINEFMVSLTEDHGLIKCSTERPKVVLPKKIIFHNRQAIGDILMMTTGIRDFAKAFPDTKIKVESTAMHIWDNNPNICRDTWDGELLDPKKEKISDTEIPAKTQELAKIALKTDKVLKVYIGPAKATNASNRMDNHFANAYRLSIQHMLGIEFDQGPIRPDIYMSQKEYDATPIIKPPYWLITAGEKGDWTAKTYPFKVWQKFVANNKDMTFVQLGQEGHKHPKLSGGNVINFIGKTQDRNTGIRDIFNLFLNCEGSIGLVSFQMHLAAAFNLPTITIAGAREPVWFTRYPGQQYLATDGCLPCTITNNDSPTACWVCDASARCKYIKNVGGQDVPLCASIINLQDIQRAYDQYYEGGRLDKKNPSKKSKLINITQSESSIPIVQPQIKQPPKISKYDIPFGGGSLTDRDWDFLKNVIASYKVESVLEFGAGLSTLLLNDIENLKVITYETNQGWIDKIKAINPKCEIRQWDGKNMSSKGIDKFDLCFVDGPAGGQNRELSTEIASIQSELIVVHDAGREWEKKWQDKYLKDKFDLAEKGGHRCHFWKKTTSTKKPTPKKPIEFSNDNPTIHFVFNGRGEGGAERSTTWLMNKFVELGYNVKYFTPSHASGTFRKEGDSAIQVIEKDFTGFDSECDLLVLYTNDWVWEFGKPEVQSLFENVQAKKKIMIVNYRMGNIGKVEWTKSFDKYMFLNSSLENLLLERIPEAKTKVLPPPTDLTSFYKNKPDYAGNLKIVRHSSQGDTKYPKDFNDKIKQILAVHKNATIRLMPAPSFLDNSGVFAHKRNVPPVKDFLGLGNVFWYSLPDGYEDQGPKVLMEAMSSGLTVVADNHSGAKDRIKNNVTGFLCDTFEDHLDAFVILQNAQTRKKMGAEARRFAKKEFNPENWIKNILE